MFFKRKPKAKIIRSEENGKVYYRVKVRDHGSTYLWLEDGGHLWLSEGLATKYTSEWMAECAYYRYERGEDWGMVKEIW